MSRPSRGGCDRHGPDRAAAILFAKEGADVVVACLDEREDFARSDAGRVERLIMNA